MKANDFFKKAMSRRDDLAYDVSYQVMSFKYSNGLTFTEIANKMGISRQWLDTLIKTNDWSDQQKANLKKIGVKFKDN